MATTKMIPSEDFNALYDEIQDITNRAIVFAGWQGMTGNSSHLIEQLHDVATSFSNVAHLLHEEYAWGSKEN